MKEKEKMSKLLDWTVYDNNLLKMTSVFVEDK